MIFFLALKDLSETIHEHCIDGANDDQESAYIPTQGIDITKQVIGDAGVFRIWDCAGHVEYHVSHSMFLGAENSIFIVVYNLNKDLHSKDVSLNIWFNLLINRSMLSLFRRILVFHNSILFVWNFIHTFMPSLYVFTYMSHLETF